ncbi:unnamed protein product [Rhizophagus irregularis]|nr:unnamed protein product [Rhizophagus irregularis]
MSIRCDRGGVCINRIGLTEETRKRHKGTRMIECPFELHAARRNGLWCLEVHIANHNHECSEDMSGHSIARQLKDPQLEIVEVMTVAGSCPQEILTTLRQNNSSVLAVNRDIYNVREKFCQKNLAGRTPIQALIDKLKEGNFVYEYKCDDTGCITHLFFAHNESVALTRQFSSVLLMDCTYKTNKFKMPLLNVIGITSFNTTFNSCFIFMKGEEKTDYQWALTHIAHLFDGMSKPGVIVTDRELALMNALEMIFPNSANLLSVENDEEGDGWQLFLGKWNDVVESTTEVEFNEKWQMFCSTYDNKPHVITYFKNTWIPWKEKFVKAWTNGFFHLGTTVTSRVEGAHSNLKANLQVSTGDLYRVHAVISLMVTSKVSKFALKKINEQYQKAAHATTQEPLSPCTGFFSKTMGLPCAHYIQHLVNTSQGLTLDNIHKHWWIQEYSLMQDENVFHHEDTLQPILQNLQEKYQEWPEFQQKVAQETLNNTVPGEKNGEIGA